ncbi:helicase-associated domain-containing protein [Kitasatospora viridis]|uniref:XPB/Ssl2-like helicase family protein n=1 Tax=Kitasatospora viridis TaxID=281105 RepID=A0A561UGE5_9ACTN|nr:helicase-associated domain-containing protein [Kitasatospora viridis]TWF98433.1 XPB/Ssl2-like helicase family protein [Kitasatospora viridis]
MTTESNGRPGRARARTLADELRASGDEQLATLLRLRPDLLNPVPTDLTQLSARLSGRASALRALERLDAFTLQVAEALAAAPGESSTGCPDTVVRDLLAGPARGAKPHPDAEPVDRSAVLAALPGALAALRERALLWGPDGALHLVIAVREALAPTAGAPGGTGLGPTLSEATLGMSPARLQQLLQGAGLPGTPDPVTAVAALTDLLTDRKRCAALLAEAPPAALGVLEKLVWGPPTGTVPDAGRPVTAEQARSPIEWLLARGLLLPSGPGSVVLPRELALHLRGGRSHRSVRPGPPPLVPTAERDPQAVDGAAAGQAHTAVRTVEELLELWGLQPPPALRAGGLGVRDLKRTATALDCTEPQAAFWLELAYGAGLMAPDGGDTGELWAPTPAYDQWLQLPVAERWAVLARGWLAATRVAGLVGTVDGKGKPRAPLGPELDRVLAPATRRAVLSLLADLPPGGVADAEALLPVQRWYRPLRGGALGPDGRDLRTQLTGFTLAEAEQLGITGRGALGSAARALLAGRDPAPVLAPLLPEPLDRVILQPDLTAIAPGPLLTPLAQVLALCAEIESKGGATVYRFTAESVRRALDAGRTAAELHSFLEQHSRTGVPQPLAYLIDDVARRHGVLRVGAACAYLRCDDPALLAEVQADRRTAELRLRLLAPTVLAAQAAPDTVLTVLRSMGYAPAAESAEGDLVITRPDSHRTPPRTAPAPVADGPAVPDDVLLAAAVKAIRAGDHAATAHRRETVPGPAGAQLPRTAAADTLAALQTAVLLGERMWIGYINAEGLATQRVIDPVKVEGGYVTAFDHQADKLATFALHRITGVAELADD